MSNFLEPSTWAGIAAILLAIAPAIPGNAGLALQIAGGAAGGVAVKLREAGCA